ncbi:MAG: DUF3822 family protein [Bacteroidales bacterium]
MDYYYLTSKFTLIPQMFFTQKNAIEAMKELHPIDKGEIIRHINIPAFKAYIIYALPSAVVSKMEPGEETYPLALALINLLKGIKDYNKVIFHYSTSHNLAHIVICKGNDLQIVNSYNADCFESAAYFLFLAIKQTIINPLQTNVHVCSDLNEQEKKIIDKYFAGVEISIIDSQINLL